MVSFGWERDGLVGGGEAGGWGRWPVPVGGVAGGGRRSGQLNRLSEGKMTEILSSAVPLTDTNLGNVAPFVFVQPKFVYCFPGQYNTISDIILIYFYQIHCDDIFYYNQQTHN